MSRRALLRLGLWQPGTAVLCKYSCRHLTHLRVVTVECRVCRQVDLFIKGSNHRRLGSTVYNIINETLVGELEVTCFGAKNREDCASLFLSLGLCCAFEHCHQERRAQVMPAQAMSDLDKRLWPFLPCLWKGTTHLRVRILPM